MFDGMLGSDETLFKNPVALDYDYLPKILPYREGEQRKIAACVKPLFNRRNGRNLIIFGKSGVGKTAACKHVLVELEEQTDEIVPIHVNCWQKNTSYKILTEMCEELGYRLTHNKKTDELLKVVVTMLNKSSAVLVFDEIDKVEDYDFLYNFLESLYRKSVVLITNHKEWYNELDSRIKSRLVPEMLEFKPYNVEETGGILKQRIVHGFQEGVFGSDSISLVTKKTHEMQDIRSGLYLLKEAANIAEEKACRKVDIEHVKIAVGKLDEFKIKDSGDLDEETQNILKIIKNNSGKKIGDLFKVYQEDGGSLVYKSFQRKVKKLEKGKYISVLTKTGGKEGTTSILSYSDKKLTDF